MCGRNGAAWKQMSERVVICLEEGGCREAAEALSGKMGAPIQETMGEELTVVFGKDGVSLKGYGLSYRGDFERMIPRVTKGRLTHEMLVKAAKSKESGRKAVDATAGMGEDSFLIAAAGYEVTLFEQNPVVACLLRDALARGREIPEIREIIERMTLVEENSVDGLAGLKGQVDLIYLDPMFPARQKSGLINKKLQLIQKLEPPCGQEEELFAAALEAKPGKIVVKRPMKAPHLAEKKPGYMLKGESIRYDCYVPGIRKEI